MSEYSDMERRPEEIEKGLNEIESEEAALEAAHAEKPARDLARDKDLDITPQERARLNQLAEQKGDLAIKKRREPMGDPEKLSESYRLESLRKAIQEKNVLENRTRRSRIYRLNSKKTEMQPSEAEWLGLLEFTEGQKIHQVIMDLYKNSNTPIPVENYKDIFKYPANDISMFNNTFRERLPAYRISVEDFNERSDKRVKLYIVS